MTTRQVFTNVNIELNKTNAPSILLEDFNYYVNKSVQQYYNKQYNHYTVDQQTTDSLRVFLSGAVLTPTFIANSINPQLDGSYEIIFPDDYVHILNCMCIYKLKSPYRCLNKGDYVQFKATKLTADIWPEINHNYYYRPTPERPYYYIYNINSTITNPTNLNNGHNAGNDYLLFDRETREVKTSHPRQVTLTFPEDTIEVDSVNREAGVRYGNTSKVRCEIRCGNSDIYELVQVRIDYLRAPQNIKLTQEQINKVRDESQILEVPDYVCYEIINELVTLMLHHNADPRLQTQNAVTQSIVSPVQQQKS